MTERRPRAESFRRRPVQAESVWRAAAIVAGTLAVTMAVVAMAYLMVR